MANNVDKRVIAIAKKYVDKVSKDYNIDGAFLIGSCAEGMQREESDIDIAILLADIKNRFTERVNLSRYSWDIDTRIEPHPIRTADYRNNQSILASEILRTGIRIV